MPDRCDVRQRRSRASPTRRRDVIDGAVACRDPLPAELRRSCDGDPKKAACGLLET